MASDNTDAIMTKDAEQVVHRCKTVLRRAQTSSTVVANLQSPFDQSPRKESGTMATDQRDQLWQMAWDAYYDSYFEEIAADLLINKWLFFDDWAKILVSLTASGSAISGWALWNDPFFRPIWIIVAGFSAVLSVVHTALGVPGRIKDWSEIKRRFTSLRIDLETFFNKMQLDPKFPITEFSDKYTEFRRLYSESTQLLKNDMLRTEGLRNQAQDRLNERLKDKIAS